ncbi:MAG: hypothetical protein DWQ34_18800 [Planctomycetota bacterium]|nr:MAG: hypothetical protein DWQ34_18800 [Planctomycetota bacterium]REK21570.1 MAG: hypothetical protein DWQ41_21120 [Planctomycetota bacterium]REK39877.1 MAG: hypothetical protein DWQ45_00975 [Planctomycetota bacterium]
MQFSPRLLCAAGSLAVFVAASRPAEAVDVYIVAGQSNGWRISHLSQGDEKAPESPHDVHYFGMKCVTEPDRPDVSPVLTRLDPNTMGYGLAESLLELSDDDIIFVQFCRCGSGLWNKKVNGWYPGDDPQNGQTHDTALYGLFLKYVAACRATAEERGLEWDLRGLFWHQGESDSRRPVAEYEPDFRNLIWRFRHDLRDGLPIVVGHIRELDDGDRAVNAMFDRLADEDPLFSAVPTRDLQFEPDRDGKPNVHIARAGCHELGRRMATALQKIEEEQTAPRNEDATEGSRR